MIGNLFSMPVLVNTLCLPHSLSLFLLVAHMARKKLSAQELQFWISYRRCVLTACDDVIEIKISIAHFMSDLIQIKEHISSYYVEL